jgi:hypothetical protein
VVNTRGSRADAGLPDEFVDALRRVPEVACVALADGDEGADLWIVVDADPVTSCRAVVPLVGEFLRTHPGGLADFHVLPSRGHDARGLLPPGSEELFVRHAG